ncbi:hypothetical protein OBBRIDRAFT_886095 [Obba rivulosa]|uniref:DUF6697 domain-containing protein n=1 Tax=Obba rivulosa TaxID=1052685 RepID=A0A8E2B236_9APHY|nr:hypothetical protein OBBRIDRAFT_886095 [Obba rivulosa]
MRGMTTPSPPPMPHATSQRTRVDSFVSQDTSPSGEDDTQPSSKRRKTKQGVITVKPEPEDVVLSVGTPSQKCSPERNMFCTIASALERAEGSASGTPEENSIPVKDEYDVKQEIILTLEQQREAVARLHNKVGLTERLPIDLDDETLNFPVSHWYIHNLYGGSFVDTFPKPNKKMLDLHGLNDWMMLSTDFNPHAPLNSGDPSPFFSSEAENGKIWPQTQRVFVMLRSGVWLYMGFYKMYPADSLTRQEYMFQHEKVKKTWAQQILIKQWGIPVRVRVYLRRERGSEPTEAEMASAARSNRTMDAIKALTWQEISRAYEVSEEACLPENFSSWFSSHALTANWCLVQCVGYDVEFQRTLVQNFHLFVLPKRKPRGELRSVNAGMQAAKGKTPQKGSKRKRAQMESDEDSDVHGSEEVEIHSVRDSGDDDSGIDESGVLQMPVGTWSRPRARK